MNSSENKVDFKLANGKITVLSGTESETNISVNIPNYQKGGTVMAGLYNISGKLLCVKSYTPAETVKVSFAQSGAYIKIMHWNMNTLMPLAKSQLINIK